MNAPRALRALEEGVEAGLHLGAQLCVWRQGQVVVDEAVGQARPQVRLRPDALMQWFSASKPLAAVAIGQLWERGLLRLDDEVAAHWPEFAGGGKGGITLRHVLTHTGGFRSRLDLEGGHRPWEEALQLVSQARKERHWPPGRKAGYHVASGWCALGEVIRRLDGRPFSRYVREEIFSPLGMENCWVGMPLERYRAYGTRMVPVYDTEGGRLREQTALDGEAVAWESPAAGGRGPARELARFYALLLGGGCLEGRRLLRSQTVEALVARQRTGLYDHTFKHRMDWGLGFVLNSAMYGVETAPYGYGRHASWRSFGHGGRQSSIAFADPEAQLVVVAIANGRPGPQAHHRRFYRLLDAIYEDLGLEAAPVGEGA